MTLKVIKLLFCVIFSCKTKTKQSLKTINLFIISVNNLKWQHEFPKAHLIKYFLWDLVMFDINLPLLMCMTIYSLLQEN